MNYLTGIATVAAIMVFYKLFLERKGRSGEESVNDVSQQSNSTAASSSISHVSEEESIDDVPTSAPRGRLTRAKRADDITSQQQLYSTTSTKPLPIGEYEVVLSFAGSGTHKHIVDILHRSLTQMKISMFRADNELGFKIWPKLLQALGEAKIYIPVISPSYAQSKWCLTELAEIVEHYQRDGRHIILPIFYMVDPRDVCNQTGALQNAFQQHKRTNVHEETIQSWKDVLRVVGFSKGWHIKTKVREVDVAEHVSRLVGSILEKDNLFGIPVEQIEEMVDLGQSIVHTDDLVGIDNQVEQLKDMLDLSSGGVNLVGVHGMGGIGKTTLAKAVYNEVFTRFDRCCMLDNIRELQEHTYGVLLLQQSLISHILRMDSSLANVHDAKKLIRDRVSQFKILVVLDDVDENFNFFEVFGNPQIFASGSRFIITSRDVKALIRLSESQSKLYEVQGMNPSHSLQLFCNHAFRNDVPLAGFEALSKDIVSSIGGLPLTLKVLGSALFRQDKVFWTDKLDQLQRRPEQDVTDRLIISYDSLQYEAQQIFLDIACFHIGKNKEIAFYMWKDCRFYPVFNVNILVQRSMITIGNRNEFQMHNQLRDMGREIIRRENIEHSLMKSRIWSNEEARQLLLSNQGTKQVEAIKVNSPSSAVWELGSESFTNLSELRYFHATGREMKVDFNHVLPNLKWLELEASRINNFNMEKLVIFAVHGLEHDSGIKNAAKLKVLNLHGCSELSKLPEFPESRSLEMLHIDHFENRQENLEIGKLHNLTSLKLQHCKFGKIQGGTIGMMERLKELHVSIDFECDFSSFKQAIADIGVLSSLQVLNVNSPHLVDVLKRIKLPKSLKFLHTASGFDNLEELLDLEELDVNGTRMSLVIPHTIMRDQLKSMRLHSMEGIFMAESDDSTMLLPSSLTRLHIRCLKSEQFPNLNDLGNLTELVLWDCPNLQEIQGLGGLKSLQLLVIVAAGKLTRIDGLGDLMSSTECRLTELLIIDCPLLPTLLTYEQRENDSVRIESLLALRIKGTPLLDGKSIPKLSKFPRLKELEIGEISLNIDSEESASQLLEGLEDLKYLVELKVHHLPKVQRLPSLSKLSKLENLELEDLPGLRQIDGLGELKLLRSIEVQICFSLERFPVAEDLPNYYGMRSIKLDFRGCTNFANVNSDLAPLADLDMHNLTIHWPDEPLEWWMNP